MAVWRANMVTLQLLLDVHVGKWLCLTWFLINVLDAQGTSPSTDTVTKARCIANCYTMTGSYNNDSEKTCQTTACQECLLPCENWDFKSSLSEPECLKACLNSGSCQASCRFLTHIRSFSSILDGDGSKSATPGIPTVVNKTFTSISLKWDPVRNTTGTAVYLIAMTITGDADRTHFFPEVFTVPQATIETRLLCALVDMGRPFGRRNFNGLYYKFNISVLTENSSISHGAQTTTISLPQPGSVSNITSPSFEYEGARSQRKLKLTVSWTPPEQSQHVSNYAIIFDYLCRPVFRELTTTGSPRPSESIYIDEEMKNCNYTLKVYALSQCIPSSVTMITYEYPGCKNITSYPTDLCYEFDPPDSPNEHREVRNVNYSVMSIDADYTFTMNVTWDPPIYPYKRVESYNVIWELRNDWINIKSEKSNVASYSLRPLIPGGVYDIRLKPNFEGDSPPGNDKEFSISTPHINPHDVTVRNLDFTFLPQTGNFDLNVTWLKPSFNYSRMSSYSLSYQLNGEKKITTSTDKLYYTIYGITHGEPVAFNITPQYNPVHYWIKGKETVAKSSAPDPDPSQVTVKSLVLNFTFNLQTEKFSLHVTWEKPLFNYSQITSYAISYRVDNGKETITQTKKPYFNIDGISHGQPVAFNVTPQYANNRIRAVTSVKKTKGPVPNNTEISVQQLQRPGDFVEDKQTNTFAVNFTWKPPSFRYRDVLYYNLSYEFSGYPRDQFPCSSFVKDQRCTITGVKETRFMLSGILPRDLVTIEVTPVYSDKYILGKMQRKKEMAPGPRGELLKVVGLSHDALVPSSNELFRTRVSWQKPLFNHSGVSHYRYKITNGTDKMVRNFQRRAIDTVFTTQYTNVTIEGIQLGYAVEFEVTPVFTVRMVTGKEASITILKVKKGGQELSSSMTPGETAALVLGLLLLILIVIGSMIWCYRDRQRKMEAKGLVTGKHALMIDHWEVDGDLVSLEEELGEGAFGKVYKGTLKGHIPVSHKWLSLKTPANTSRTATIKGKEMFTVAVKMLHNMADSDQRREFLEEIQLMKAVGSHKNIVNMLGCCTVEEPMFLLVEYVPYGDLLHYLRKHRSKVMEYLGDDSRGPYRSTYCETYFTDESPTGISVKVTKNDRIYINSADMQNEKNGDIQLLSFNSHKTEVSEIGEENRGLDTQENEDKNEEVLTPGDLMAFAWQISQGMEYLAKKGFVHRDLAARNVLVGEKKIAKVADFGLTRHVYEEKVYHAKRNRKLPLKWMSIEAIFDQTFTAQSDVWAFGVVLWELVTLGGTPYPAIDNKELLRLLKDGYRMEKPDTCNDELYNMMIDCWKKCPEARPTFTQIKQRLEEVMQKDNPYLDLSALDETKDYYNVASFDSLAEESTDDLFDKDDVQCHHDSKENEELGREKPNGDSNGNETKSFEQIEKEKNTKNTVAYDGYGKIDDRGGKNVTINFDEIEMSVYRSAARGTGL